MQPRILKLIDSVRTSYWFLPSIMALLALVLGFGVIYIDAKVGSDWLDSLSWYQANKPEGAQEVLSTIAGSAITVAGVVFSITIVSISYAASQYGPRVLTNFMSDRGNQVTLGTFIATFLYCLVVLRTVRGGDSDFVPDLAIIVALVLALCSIGVLIFFIHHVPKSIHVNTILAGIGKQLVFSLQDRYPDFIGDEVSGSPDGEAVPEVLLDPSLPAPSTLAPACATSTGYIEAIDDAQLMEIAGAANLMIRLQKRPGDYVHTGQTFALVWPGVGQDPKVIERIQATLIIGEQRTPMQNTAFLVDELVEVGARALSPGVNDPFTAISCLDWLRAALCELSRRNLPSAFRVDAEGRVRVIADPMTFESYVQRALGRFRQYLASDRIACLHGVATIETIAVACAAQHQIRALLDELESLDAAAKNGLDAALYASVGEAVRSSQDKIARQLVAIG